MQIIATLKEIIDICWRERMTALKYAIVPWAINLSLAIWVTDTGDKSLSGQLTNTAIGLLSILVYAPMTVAWYRLILNGPSDIAQRPIFLMTARELRFFGWTLLISIKLVLWAIVFGIAGAAVLFALFAVNKVVGIIGAIAMSGLGIAYMLMALSRWSIGLAMVATGQPMNQQQAWEAGKPYGWKMAAIQIVIFTATALVVSVLTYPYLVVYLKALTAQTTSPADATTIVLIASNTVGVVALLMTATLYAIVYRIAVLGDAGPGLFNPTDEATRTTEMESVLAFLARHRESTSKTTIGDFRDGMEKFGASFPIQTDVAVREATLSGVPGRWYAAPGARADRAILYLHGGGFTVGSSRSHGRLAADLSREASARVLVIDYRLAPEHPFPAAVDDVVAAYTGLLAEGLKAEHIALAGDSAGGNLVIAAMLKARDQATPKPACAVCMSPWVNLACNGETYETKKADDPIATFEALAAAAKSYLGTSDATHVLASPYLADLTGLPPLLIQAGTREVLLDDARRLANSAKACGVDVHSEEWPGMIHNWQMFADMLTDAKRANARIGSFVRQHLR